MIRAVVDEVLKHLPEQLRLQHAGRSAIFDRTLDAVLAESIDERAKTRLDVMRRKWS